MNRPADKHCRPELNDNDAVEPGPIPHDFSDRRPGVLFRIHRGGGTGLVFSYVSSPAAELLGLDSAALILDSSLLFARLSSEDLAQVHAGLTGACAPQGEWSGQFSLSVKGKTRWFEIHANVNSHCADGMCADGYLTDISIRVSLEQERALTTAARDQLQTELLVQTNALPIALVVVDPNDEFRIVEWNSEAEKIFGYRRDEVLGRPPYELIVPVEEQEYVRKAFHSIVTSQQNVRGIGYNLTKGGHRICCDWSNAVVRDAGGRALRIVSMVKDLTDRVAEAERTRLWTAMIEQSSEGVMVCDPLLAIVRVNTTFQKLTGYSEQEVVGKTPRLLQSGQHDRAFYAAMWRELAVSGQWSGEISNRRKSGELYVEWLTIRAIYNTDSVVTHYVGNFSDITEQKATKERAQYLTQHDALTGLPNRALVMQLLEQRISVSMRDHTGFALLFIDLDRFRNINDSMGHGAGDTLLQEVARRITATVRRTDVVARMGGDEFMVVLSESHEAGDAARIAQKILGAIGLPLQLEGQDLVVSASIGMCMYPSDGGTGAELVGNAEAAMYGAKHDGPNSQKFYAPQMNEHSVEMLKTENALRAALHHQQFVLYYQPQVDLSSGAIVGAEALIRWNRPGVGLVPPGQFIPIAEERGLICDIGNWVVAAVLQQMQAWDAAGLPPVTIAANLSAAHFHQRGFAANLIDLVRNCGIDPARLELELTESIAVQDVAATTRTLEQLHRFGTKLSLDDFGTGYSCLSHLRNFPIDKIKIDQSFVREMLTSPSAMRIVRAIIALAKSLDMKVIAEGVETPQQAAALRAEHCDELQGYLASVPLPAEHFFELLRHWQPDRMEQPAGAAANAAGSGWWAHSAGNRS